MHSSKNLILLLYVNNINIVKRFITNINWFKNVFASIFKIKNLIEIEKILDVQIFCNRINRTLRMNQTHYFKKVLKKLYIKVYKHDFTEYLMNDYNFLRLADLEN